MQISGIFKMIIVLMVLVNSSLLFTSCSATSINNSQSDSQSIGNEYKGQHPDHKGHHPVHKGHGGGGGGGGGGR